MNLKLVAHKTYSYKSIVYRAGSAFFAQDDLAEELLSLNSDAGSPVFAQADEDEDDERGPAVASSSKPLRQSTVKFSGGKKTSGPDPKSEGKAEPVQESKGGAKDGGDLKTVTV